MQGTCVWSLGQEYPLEKGMEILSLLVWIFATWCTVAHQAPLEFSRQEYWSGLPFPSSGSPTCRHEIKRCLLLGRKVMSNLDSIFKSRDIPWMEEPDRLQSMGSLELDTTEGLHFHFSLSCIGEGNGNPLRCSCLENTRDGASWWAAGLWDHRFGYDWSDLAAAAADTYCEMFDELKHSCVHFYPFHMAFFYQKQKIPLNAISLLRWHHPN